MLLQLYPINKNCAKKNPGGLFTGVFKQVFIRSGDPEKFENHYQLLNRKPTV